VRRRAASARPARPHPSPPSGMPSMRRPAWHCGACRWTEICWLPNEHETDLADAEDLGQLRDWDDAAATRSRVRGPPQRSAECLQRSELQRSAARAWLGLMAGAHGLREILGRKSPVGEFVDHSVDMIRTLVLVVEIVGMFPHIDR